MTECNQIHLLKSCKYNFVLLVLYWIIFSEVQILFLALHLSVASITLQMQVVIPDSNKLINPDLLLWMK